MIFLDFETRSRVNIKTVGGHAYAADESSEILCGAALDVRTQPAVFYVWSPWAGPLGRWHMKAEWLDELGIDPEEIAYAEPLLGSDDLPEPILAAAADGVPFCAHNSWGFDAHVWEGCGLPPVAEWVDTVPLSRRRGLPGDLQRVGEAVFGIGKDGAGARVLRTAWAPRTRGPRKGEFLDPDGPRLNAIVRYCVKDVALMACAYLSEGMDAPHVDDPTLRVHQAIDDRGVNVDLELTRLLLAVDQASALAEVEACAVDLTTLRSPVALAAWLKDHGCKVDNVQAPTIRAALSDLDK